MSGLWLGLLLGGQCGLLVGVVVGLLVRRQPGHAPGIEPEAGEEVLAEADRQRIAGEFETHTAAVRQQVSEYADALADGDVDLRERLRRIEAGVSW